MFLRRLVLLTLASGAALLAVNCGVPEYVDPPDAGTGGTGGSAASGGSSGDGGTGDGGTGGGTGGSSGSSGSGGSAGALPECENGSQDPGETDEDCGGPDCSPCELGERCEVDADCINDSCVDDRCQSATCVNGVQDGDEVAPDCGGGCGLCPENSPCGEDAHCESGSCEGMVCVPATCNDEKQNQGEGAIDCGDPAGTCPRCPAGTDCTEDAQCDSGSCDDGKCSEASCSDTIENQDETDVDCGGSCEPCADDLGCAQPLDCVSKNCGTNLRCVAAVCDDDLQNGDETDVDCGGSCPLKCDVMQKCRLNADCIQGVCIQGVDGLACQSAACGDEVDNGMETDVDCGGPECSPCAVDRGCALGRDCQSGVCTGNICQPPSCSDGIKNGTEAAVDCGGGCPTLCDDGETCTNKTDCESGVCGSGMCQPPSCGDGVKNGTESGVDCGRACASESPPQRCPSGGGCAVGADCESGVCDAGSCKAPTCSDQAKNGAETDIDCGGATCAKCDTGRSCLAEGDCASQVCSGSPKACQAPTCSDGKKNGNETDVDCGGSCPSKCGNTLLCNGGGDCQSGVCSGSPSRCQAATCSDGVKNGSETDIDCGGAGCSKCGAQKACLGNADCSTGVCTNGFCQAASCNDSTRNGDETDVDCGGSCADCVNGRLCSVAGDCQSGVCSGNPRRCQAPTCSDDVRNGSETDVDCGGSCSTKCGTNGLCAGSADCASGVCSGGRCQAPSCSDGVRNGSETAVDCGGSACPKCTTSAACNANSDCQSGVCSGSPKACQAPTCSDGVKNQGEGDVDCGGPCSAQQPCDLGDTCNANADCRTENCAGSGTKTCQLPPCIYSVGYRSRDSGAIENRIQPSLRIHNTGPTALDLTKVSLRYWFTNSTGGNAGQLESACLTYPDPLESCSDYFREFTGTGADRSLLITFNTGFLGAGQSMGPLDIDIFKSGGDNRLIETDDWSYPDSSDADQWRDPWQYVTLYFNGVHVWGCEPNTSCVPACQ